ncbi:transcriptional regulator [Actinorhabdospora filicis]|uniref:Transcriptional regulator n=1 Tax=Actinorhabdospora filicis TaxID=1785913 RepID=A0A9W6SSK8_9ACTN|nr:GyrI-like domain-containing protein [Actinorhabdospora filicis]GLZ81313.1 transcriptional regulator [Actinorhabdospora filicis]
MTDPYKATAKPSLADVPEAPYLMVDGVGAPASEEFATAVGALYRCAYAVRALRPVKEKVRPLSGLWQGDHQGDRADWKWTIMIELPSDVDAELAARALETAAKQGPIGGVRHERWAEGTVAQILHVGPFSEELSTVERLMAWIAEQGLRVSGLHHEVYLSDFRRVDPAKQRTILRYPVSRDA